MPVGRGSRRAVTSFSDEFQFPLRFTIAIHSAIADHGRRVGVFNTVVEAKGGREHSAEPKSVGPVGRGSRRAVTSSVCDSISAHRVMALRNRPCACAKVTARQEPRPTDLLWPRPAGLGSDWLRFTGPLRLTLCPRCQG